MPGPRRDWARGDGGRELAGKGPNERGAQDVLRRRRNDFTSGRERNMDRRILIAVARVSLAGRARVATAAPYASGISNAGGTVAVPLNQDGGTVSASVNGTPKALAA